eukprot:UN01771
MFSFLYRFALNPTTFLIAFVLSSITVRSCYISSMSSQQYMCQCQKENQLNIQDKFFVQLNSLGKCARKKIWF